MPTREQERWASAERTGVCGICGEATGQGCTAYTCTTPCGTCGHPGERHKDWYVHLGRPVFCASCDLEASAREHPFTVTTDHPTEQ
ncbi:hypothetical protein [Streptomyces clavifer]|uniref:hypothetical protein n=1 Tax=Streptomyces clavifer TaxID=68188 RepID=UPI0036C2DD01